jgi:hypothetical protein
MHLTLGHSVLVGLLTGQGRNGIMSTQMLEGERVMPDISV